MSTRATKTRARVQILVEVDGGTPWGDDANLGTVYQQAKEHALVTVRNAIYPDMRSSVRIIGEPRVTSVITEVDP